jgi:ADP-ribose diphosphatase
MEQWVSRKKVYEGTIFDVIAGEAMLDDGRKAHREVVEHAGGVALVPILDDQILLVRQFRIAVDDYLLEIPAGKREGREPPDHRAVLELQEETGYRAGKLQLLASYYSSAGFTNERMFIYLATGLVADRRAPDPGEQIEVVPVPLAGVQEMISDGRIIDAKTIIGIRELLARPDLLQGEE